MMEIKEMKMYNFTLAQNTANVFGIQLMVVKSCLLQAIIVETIFVYETKLESNTQSKLTLP